MERMEIIVFQNGEKKMTFEASETVRDALDGYPSCDFVSQEGFIYPLDTLLSSIPSPARILKKNQLVVHTNVNEEIATFEEKDTVNSLIQARCLPDPSVRLRHFSLGVPYEDVRLADIREKIGKVWLDDCRHIRSEHNNTIIRNLSSAMEMLSVDPVMGGWMIDWPDWVKKGFTGEKAENVIKIVQQSVNGQTQLYLRGEIDDDNLSRIAKSISGTKLTDLTLEGMTVDEKKATSLIALMGKMNSLTLKNCTIDVATSSVLQHEVQTHPALHFTIREDFPDSTNLPALEDHSVPEDHSVLEDRFAIDEPSAIDPKSSNLFIEHDKGHSLRFRRQRSRRSPARRKR